MPSKTLPKPDYATKNMRLVGHSDQGGRCDGVQIMVHRGYAYIGHSRLDRRHRFAETPSRPGVAVGEKSTAMSGWCFAQARHYRVENRAATMDSGHREPRAARTDFLVADAVLRNRSPPVSSPVLAANTG